MLLIECVGGGRTPSDEGRLQGAGGHELTVAAAGLQGQVGICAARQGHRPCWDPFWCGGAAAAASSAQGDCVPPQSP